MTVRRRQHKRTKPLPDRVVSRGHLRWTAGCECVVARKTSPKYGHRHIPCGGKMDPHHVKTRGAGGGDDQVVPLCRDHHSQLDSWGIGQETFQDIYGVDLPKLAGETWMADSYHRRKWDIERRAAQF